MDRADITKLVIAAILFLFVAFLGTQIWNFRSRAAAARKAYEAARIALDERQEEAAHLEAELKYYSNPVNFLKELRARFNYRFPDERGIILVPSSTTSD